jgi:hypothetical protein
LRLFEEKSEKIIETIFALNLELGSLMNRKCKMATSGIIEIKPAVHEKKVEEGRK